MKKISYIALLALAFSSCKKNLPDVGSTSTQMLANEWWVTLSLNGQDAGIGHQRIMTYNTDDNNQDLWIDDLEHVWDFKVKAQADLSALTFTATNANNEYYPITVTIRNGKVLPKAGHSKTGTVTDSIYMEAVFSDDPTHAYTISGVGRTGWPQDDY